MLYSRLVELLSSVRDEKTHKKGTGQSEPLLYMELGLSVPVIADYQGEKWILASTLHFMLCSPHKGLPQRVPE